VAGVRVARVSGRRRRAPATQALSAGGIVVRHTEGGAEILLGRRRRERDGSTWSLPKGTPDGDETREETAIREVQEETGLSVRIVSDVGEIHYVFFQDGRRIHKTVHYFLMEATGGDLAEHDHEFEDVRWVPLGEAERLMTFPTERDIVARALPPTPPC
jgi:8-oxo-dGTP pyrophosphatase MutT (NUDIX family)